MDRGVPERGIPSAWLHEAWQHLPFPGCRMLQKEKQTSSKNLPMMAQQKETSRRETEQMESGLPPLGIAKMN